MIALDAILSIKLNVGQKPCLLKYAMLLLNASIVDPSFTYLTGEARMALVVQSYRMKMAVMPLMERIRKVPV